MAMLPTMPARADTALAADWGEHARDVLGRAGHHRGAARDRVIDLLAAQHCALSAIEIEDALRRGRRGERTVGRASIYRVLELLHAHDLVNRLDLGDGIARYEPTDPDGQHHHHHLVCDQCGKLVAFKDAGLERTIDRLSDRLGFRTTDHEVTLRGNCPDCQ
jgi:Fur family transcriptional regulator, ferric uptake regulator